MTIGPASFGERQVRLDIASGDDPSRYPVDVDERRCDGKVSGDRRAMWDISRQPQIALVIRRWLLVSTNGVQAIDMGNDTDILGNT